MSDTPRQPDAQNTIAGKPCRVIIDVESARRMRKQLLEQRRSNLTAAQHAFETVKILDLIIEQAS